jgi:CRP/FNR family transcriptional regulator
MEDLKNDIQRIFPLLRDTALVQEISENAQVMEFEAGDVLMDFGSYVKIMPLVIKGAVKVLRESDGDEGGELFLYYLYPGQSCAMTLNCGRINSPSEIKAVAEENTKIIAIPVQYINKWMDKYADWKEFTLQIYSSRFAELLQTLDSIAFHHMDERLINYLQHQIKAKKSQELQITHQQIAYDLNTSREVISRLLKKLEKNGVIKQGRNRLEIIEPM